MRFAYTADQLLVRDTVRAFATERIAPGAREWSEAGRFPPGMVKEAAALGLTGLAVPTEHGGAGLDVLTIALVMEELAAADGSFALTLAAHNSLCIGHLLVAASDEQKRRWLPPLAAGDHLGAWALTEPGSGSDAAAARTRARRDGDRYVLDGQKQFITNGSLAGFTVVIAATGEPRAEAAGGGAPVRGRGPELSAFGIARGTAGLRAGRPEHKMGLLASDTSPLVLEGCGVPTQDRIGEEGKGFDDVKKVLDRGRIGIGAIAIGLGRGALDTAVAYAKQRRQFGRRIADFQMVAWRIVKARVELDAGRLLVHRAAALAEAGRPFAAAASMAKLYASEAGTRAADAAIQVLGGYGYLRDHPVERMYRDVRLMEIGEGTSEVQRIVIARSLLRAS